MTSRDKVVSFLQQAVVDEDEYLRYRISERFNGIMKSLFDAHKKDAESGEELPFVSEMEEDVQTYLEHKDNPAKGKLIIFARKIGLNLANLSDEELKAVDKALQRSTVYKAEINKKRKKRKK